VAFVFSEVGGFTPGSTKVISDAPTGSVKVSIKSTSTFPRFAVDIGVFGGM
jgi:hypothetical protein